jgi:PAS domain S-box-containing protein
MTPGSSQRRKRTTPTRKAAKTDSPAELRRAAEQSIGKKKLSDRALANVDREHLIHEMQVHQVELEIQNEELKRLKDEAEVLAARYRDVYDFAPVGYFTLIRGGKIVQANITASGMFGVPTAHLIGARLASWVAPRSSAAFAEFLERNALTETEAETEAETETETETETFEFLRGGKTPFFAQVESRVSPNRRQCRLAMIDVTERKKAEEGRRRYELLASHGRDIILFADSENGRILDANAAAVAAYGYSTEELCALTLADLCVTGAMASAVSQTAEINGRGLLFESLHRRKDRSVFPVEIGLGGTVYNGRQTMIAVIRDISARKATEKALEEKTAQIESANRELESYSYSVSHDLQTPLRAIDGYARMILRKRGAELDEESRGKFEVIRANIQRMGQLIEGLLSFSRLGRKPLSVGALDMETVINDAWEELKMLNPARSIILRTTCLPLGMGDRMLIRQVVSNLLANAIKFTRSRAEAVVEVAGYVEGKEAVYSIRDNGVGFDMAYYDKLFGMFQRLHSPDEYEGTGIGLAIVQRIVLRHGGRIWAEGKVNKGATFSFSLPRVEATTNKR